MWGCHVLSKDGVRWKGSEAAPKGLPVPKPKSGMIVLDDDPEMESISVRPQGYRQSSGKRGAPCGRTPVSKWGATQG